MAYELESGYLRKAQRITERHARARAIKILSKFRPTVTTKTRQGVFTVSTKDTGVGGNIFVWRQHEFDDSLAAFDFLQERGFVPAANNVMLDVGANIGVISIGLIVAGRVERAACFEPEPAAYELLVRNVRQNGFSDRIACLQVALGDESTTLTLEKSNDNLGDHRVRSATPIGTVDLDNERQRSTISVKSLPLDDALREPEIVSASLGDPTLMWVDVQGYEGFAFAGASQLLRDGLPTVTEIWPYAILRAGMTLERFCEVVATYWDTYWVVRRGRFTSYPITVLDRYIDELGMGQYQENVIFTNAAPRFPATKTS